MILSGEEDGKTIKMEFTYSINGNKLTTYYNAKPHLTNEYLESIRVENIESLVIEKALFICNLNKK